MVFEVVEDNAKDLILTVGGFVGGGRDRGVLFTLLDPRYVSNKTRLLASRIRAVTYCSGIEWKLL